MNAMTTQAAQSFGRPQKRISGPKLGKRAQTLLAKGFCFPNIKAAYDYNCFGAQNTHQ